MNSVDIQKRLTFYNPWWEEKALPSALVPSFRRDVFEELLKHLNLNRVIVLKGPRQTGKTTLMYQIADMLFEDTSEKNILYINFEDPLLRIDLSHLLSLYEKTTLRRINKGETVYILLDEVQLLKNWAEQVKAFFDRKYPLKFVVSGSSATLLQKGSESLAGRTIEELILPLSFREWVRYSFLQKNKPFDVNGDNYHLYRNEIEILWEQYLKQGGFPNLLEVEEEKIRTKLLFEDIIDKVIYKDLVGLYKIRHPAVLEKALYYLVSGSGELLNIQGLSKTLGENRHTLQTYLTYLKQAYLYYDMYKYSRSVKQSVGSLTKINLVDTGFFKLYQITNKGKIWETAIARHFWEKFGRKTFYWRNRYEVDIVAEKDNKPLPIEVKSTDSISPSGIKGLYSFMEKYKLDKGFVVYAGEDKIKKEKIGKISFLNAPKLILLNNYPTPPQP